MELWRIRKEVLSMIDYYESNLLGRIANSRPDKDSDWLGSEPLVDTYAIKQIKYWKDILEIIESQIDSTNKDTLI